MNTATEHAVATGQLHFRRVPLDHIQPSTTHIQEMRRARFDAERLKELAESIKTLGLQQPIVLRPNVRRDNAADAAYEIVAGERRWRASQIAGLSDIEAKISPLTDEQVLEVQLVENLQREGLHELEEAEGYEQLMKLKGITADEVADKVGKSRSYVFARLKLLALCPEARKGFYAGKINASVALLIARIGHHDTQRQAFKDVSTPGWSDEPLSYRQARDHIEQRYMLELKDAPFNTKAIYFRTGAQAAKPIAGNCADCPKRTGNQKDLFADVKNADVCTDPVCWADKRAAHNRLVADEARAKGRPVIEGNAAKAIKRHQYADLTGFIPVDKQAPETNWKEPRKVLGKDLPATAIFMDPYSGDAIEVIAEKDLQAAMKKKGIQYHARPSGNGRSSEQDRREAEAQKILTAARLQILQRIREVNRTRPRDDADAKLVQAFCFEHLGFDSQKRLVDALMAEQGKPKPKGTEYVRDYLPTLLDLPADERAVLMIDMALIGSCHHYGDAEDLMATAQRLGIDPKAIEADVKAEFKARAKAKKWLSKKAAKASQAATADDEDDEEGGEE